MPAIDSTVPMAARSTTIIAQSHSPSITQDTNAPAMVGSPLAEADGEKLKKRQSLSQQYDGEWLTPIEFYGLVIDESNNPVADVQIDFSCSDMSPTGTSDYHAASGANGLFSLKNVTGKLLVIKSISKSGY
ncbi:MAG TPA: hypothetical protein VG347_07125, partial [Verrucomicrobiae bacterium]|nr:hypothetical protein [Verrucomicrobiae bacterium]